MLFKVGEVLQQTIFNILNYEYFHLFQVDGYNTYTPLVKI